jgi:hypothetical protein
VIAFGLEIADVVLEGRYQQVDLRRSRAGFFTQPTEFLGERRAFVI